MPQLWCHIFDQQVLCFVSWSVIPRGKPGHISMQQSHLWLYHLQVWFVLPLRAKTIKRNWKEVPPCFAPKFISFQKIWLQVMFHFGVTFYWNICLCWLKERKKCIYIVHHIQLKEHVPVAVKCFCTQICLTYSLKLSIRGVLRKNYGNKLHH